MCLTRKSLLPPGTGLGNSALGSSVCLIILGVCCRVFWMVAKWLLGCSLLDRFPSLYSVLRNGLGSFPLVKSIRFLFSIRYSCSQHVRDKLVSLS